ncbi:hypothetical protein Tco_1022793 [Tanacetum coccineum]
MKLKESTYQVVLDALSLTTCYHAFLITVEVPVIYMHKFWATVDKHKASYRFKIDNKKFFVNVEVFKDILNICPRIPGQEFDEPPTEEWYKYPSTTSFVSVDHLHQPWRTFASIINKCLCGKVFGLDKIRLSRVQILWGMYYKKNLDFVALILEDLAYQIDNKDSKKQDKMFYPRFIKIIIHHFFEKDKYISMRNKMFMHTARDDSLLGTMRFVSRYEDTQVYGAILLKSITNQATLDSVAYKTYYVIASGGEPPKSKKLKRKSDSAILFEESPSKKKPTSKPNRIKKVTKRSKKDFYISHESSSSDGTDFQSGVLDEQQRKISVTDEGTGAKPGVSDVPKYDSNSNKESWGDSGEEDDDEDDDEDDIEDDEGNDGDDDNDGDHERTESDRDENPNLNQFNEEHDEEEEENVDEFTDKEDDEENEEELDDGFEQEEEDAHVTLTTIHDIQKTKGPMQSSSVSSDFTEKLLNFENVSPADNKIASLMDTTIHHEEPSALEVTTAFPSLLYFASVFRFNDRVTNLKSDLSEMKQVDQEEVKTQLPYILPKVVSDFATPVIEQNVTESLEDVVLAKSSSQPKSTYKAYASLIEYELIKILLDKLEESKSHLRADYKRELYDVLVKSYNTDKDLFETYGKVFTLKRSRDEKDKDQDPSARSDRGTKRRKSSKEVESQKDPTLIEGKSSSSSKDTTHSHHKSFGKQHVDFQPPQTWISVIARAEKPLTSFDELMDTPIDFSAFVMNQLNITNLTQELLVGPAFNLLKGTCKSLAELEYHFEEYHRGSQVIPQDYFINNDQEYLKRGSLRRQYSTSVIKIKAATYEIKWIEDTIHNLWNTIKVIIKKYDYDHLDEIEVCREDQQLYTFKEGDFLRLRLQDIEDMLLLLVQQKLTNLTIDERYDLNVALCMFTRRIVIQRRVEDLQLGVKSYQKKLNLTKPDIFRSNNRNRTAYTTYSDPQGVIYTDQNNKNRLLHSNELHKFSDGTLNDVRTALHDITSRIRMEYLPKRKWSGLDKRRAHVMIQDIDKQLFQRRLMRNLEKFIGGREYEEDLRLLTEII